MKRTIASFFLIAVLLSSMALSAQRAQSQVQVSMDVDIVQEVLDVNMTTDANFTFELEGLVNITKPPSRLIIVEVTFSVTAPACLTVSMEPSALTFTEPGSKTFMLKIGIPAVLDNATKISVTVVGTATTTAFPTVTDEDAVILSITNAPASPPPQEPNDDGEADLDVLGPQVGLMCGVSVLLGVVVGGLLFLKSRQERKNRTQVIYIPRHDDDIERFKK